jgi:hypothetical protein
MKLFGKITMLFTTMTGLAIIGLYYFIDVLKSSDDDDYFWE